MNKRNMGPFGEDRFADQRTKTRVLILIAALVIGSSAAMGEELPAASRDTIATGLVFAYGNELHPPYVLEIVGRSVRVNGIQVFPVLDENGEAPDLGPKPPPPEPSRSLWALKRELEAQGVPLDEITLRMALFMEVQEGVDSVEVTHFATFWVYWSDGSKEEFVTYPIPPPPSMEEQCQTELRMYRRLLEHDEIVVISSAGELYCPRSAGMVDRLMAEIDRARKATVEELQNWAGDMIDSGIARQFAQPLRIEED